MGSEWAFRSLLVKAANTSGRQGMAGQTEESVIGHWRKEDSCCKVLESLAKLSLVVTQKIGKKVTFVLEVWDTWVMHTAMYYHL